MKPRLRLGAAPVGRGGSGPPRRLYWEFRTTTGISTGTTFEECRQGREGNALPLRIDAKDLSRQRTIKVGTVLGTETREGNLAMLKVTEITPSAESDLPDVLTELTLRENA
ncbi:hypothetical protein [Streptomyces sp. NPDC053560]|uniref:hypothetical protein n=1 Tax=Streptomyces sp. NPDC053560 TaxID=3365711 RepID=UPI0037D17F56